MEVIDWVLEDQKYVFEGNLSSDEKIYKHNKII